MDVTRVRALRGPNLWTRHTALELVVELPPEERSIDTMSRYEARLRPFVDKNQELIEISKKAGFAEAGLQNAMFVALEEAKVAIELDA